MKSVSYSAVILGNLGRFPHQWVTAQKTNERHCANQHDDAAEHSRATGEYPSRLRFHPNRERIHEGQKPTISIQAWVIQKEGE